MTAGSVPGPSIWASPPTPSWSPRSIRRLGLLDAVETGGPPPSRFRPRHFAGGYGLELKHGYALGPEIVLQEPAHASGWSDFRPQPA